MKEGRTLVDLAQELDRQASTKKDFKADTRALKFTTNGETRLTVGGVGSFPIRPIAHEQISERLNIPKKYYDRMLTEAPHLLDTNVNHWFQTKPEVRMVRTLDNQARAFLSDRYRPLDNYDLAEVAFDVMMKNGINIESCEVTERKMYIKAVTERITGEVKVGEFVQAGIVVSNSEVGLGAIVVEPLIYVLRCKNGMIAPNRNLRRHHVGKGGGDIEGASEFYKDETLLADDRAFWMKVRDTIQGSFDQEIFNRTLKKLQEASQDPIEKPIEVVEVVAKKFMLTDGVKEGILNQLIKGGDTTRYGLVQAITRYSQDVSDYDDATSLEKLGGLVLELPKSDFRVMVN